MIVVNGSIKKLENSAKMLDGMLLQGCQQPGKTWKSGKNSAFWVNSGKLRETQGIL